MSAILFDTLRLSRALREKGHFTPEQAEALAEALGEAAHDELATRADLAKLEAKIAQVRTSIAEVRSEVLKWVVVGAISLQTIIIVGRTVSVVKIFAK